MPPLRTRLPERRTADTFTVPHVWSRATPVEQVEVMTVTVGRYPDGRIGEVFLVSDHHANERAIALWHDIGVLVSIALQYGASVGELAAAVSRGEVRVMDRLEIVPHSPAGTLLDHLLALERDLPETPEVQQGRPSE